MRRGGKDIYELEKLPTWKMLLKISTPVILSLLVQAMYTLVDGIYVSWIDEAAISAVSLAFIVQHIANSLFSGIAAGMNAVISKALGAKNEQDARNATLNGCMIQLAFSALFLVFGFVGVSFYFRTSANDARIIEYGIEYLKPFMIYAFILALQLTFERTLNAVGMTGYTFISHLVGSILNVILDPIMMFGYLGFPSMGIRGAAYATILSQLASLLIYIYFNLTKNKVLFGHGIGVFDLKQVGTILAVGLPTSFLGISTSIGNYIINRIVLEFSTAALAAYGLYIKVQSVLNMPSQGVSVALVTMFSYFYGKNSKKRLMETAKCGFVTMICWGCFCALILNVFPSQILSIFETTAECRQIAVVCFKVIGLTYIMSHPFFCYTAFFQATERSYLSLIFISARQYFARIPMAILLASFGRVNLIWWCYPISEVVSDVIVIFIFIWAVRKTNEKIDRHLAVLGAQ